MEQRNRDIQETTMVSETAVISGETGIVPENDLEERYRKYREKLQEMTIMSDVFMRNVLKEAACTEYILQVIMGAKDLKVVSQTIQKDYKNLQGRSAILDCVVRDAEQNLYNVEIQQESEGASPKRARYHSGLMDMNILKAGQDFDGLPESYVIFITRDDTLGYELPIYHIVRMVRETNQDFKDESHIIYVNSGSQEETELGRLMHDLHCRRADEMYSEILAKRVWELKETEEGERTMCKIMDELIKEGEARGEARGKADGKQLGMEQKERSVAISLSKRGMSIEDIAQVVEASAENVRKWLAGDVIISS